MKNLNLYLGIAVIIVFFAGMLFLFHTSTPTENTTGTATDQILSFDGCVAGGYPVTGSSPRQCTLPDGRVYAEELPQSPTYVNATADNIVITTPAPGAVTGKQVIVTGKARGTWYFEASFPAELRDANGKLLATVAAQAQGDWMTEDFVPFSVTLTAPQSYIGPATLVLRRDNPSGLPEQDRSISIPLTIEY